MKFFALTILLSMSSAFATSYECSNVSGEKLSIYHYGQSEANVIIKGTEGNYILKGTYAYADEPLYDVIQYDLLSDNDEKATLTLSKKVHTGRGGCGRGGCDETPVFSSKKAVFKLADTTKFFDCL